MEPILEAIFQVFLELFLQIFAEALCELGMQSLAEVFKRKQFANPWLAGLGYFLLGSTIGGLSLLVVRSSLIHSSTLRMLNLLLTPILAGLTMMAVGSLRRRKGQDLVRLDRFGYGFIFAFGMALVRFIYAAKPL